MGTFEELKRLSDGQFHRLGDDLLRRIDPRYRGLRTHGLNDSGVSIIGQPDSYVGNTAASCDLAVCYTVQEKGWWNKVVQDVREAVTACPAVTEIVVVIPHNADRDGPKKKTIDWHSKAKAAAGNATLRVIDGREISQLLDTEHQDLRHEYLGIPYSRLTLASILDGCRIKSNETIDSIKASRRYDPDRYSPRDADRELYRLWQSAFRPNNEQQVAPVRLIALVNDSGVGKTSLLCEFTRSLGAVLPVILLQARNLAFGTEESLVSSVIHSIQGFLDPAVRVIEEAALSKLLSKSVPLTVVLDGLDEAHDPEAVRKAVDYWIRSKLSSVSILITTSRPEFWRMCANSSWDRWMPNEVINDRSAVKVADQSQVDNLEPCAGIRLPDRFSENELEAAWLRAGRPRTELFTQTVEAREELRHPFTLRVFLDLLKQEESPPRMVTRSALLERWLNHLLDAEALQKERITRSHFQQALQMVAKRISETRTGSVSVDELTGVPRFNSSQPPGPVVQRLIGASILESLPSQSDHIRFTVEAIQDFYRAEADVEDIKYDPTGMVDVFAKLNFTSSYSRLVRIGYRLTSEDVRHTFIQLLLEADVRKAAVVLRASPDCYSAETRARITNELGLLITNRYRVQAAMAITLLSTLNCRESVETLAKNLLPPTEPHKYLKSHGASAFVILSHAPAAEFVYSWERFGRSTRQGSYYFKELLAAIRAASTEFRIALANQAISHLQSPSGTQEHAEAVVVLAYLGNGLLVEHLSTRLAENGLLHCYENHALIAVGSEAAGNLFVQSVLAVGERLATLPNDEANHDARSELIRLCHVVSFDVRYLLTRDFEPHLQSLIEDTNQAVSWIASDLAKLGQVSSLLYPVAIAAAKRKRWLESNRSEYRSCVLSDMWLSCWRDSKDTSVRHELLKLLPLYPNAEIEQELLECLDETDLRGSVIRVLGEYGSIRSTLRLRDILAEDFSDNDWIKAEAAHVLGDLRDNAAVSILEKVAAEHSDEWVVRQSVWSLGLVGSQEAEQSLRRLLNLRKGEEFEDIVLEALLFSGSRSAVAEVVNRARQRLDGAKWLCERLNHLSWIRGKRSGEFYTHIQTAELVDYFESHSEAVASERDCGVEKAFGQIDSPEVRELLRKWASLHGTTEDPRLQENGQWRMSDVCYWELQERGDTSAIGYILEYRSDESDNLYVLVAADNLRPFPSSAVAEQLRFRLSKASTTSETLRMLALLGRFGDPSDSELASRFMDHADDQVANVACDTHSTLK